MNVALLFYFCRGEMAEWSIAAVLKTADCQRSGGSNPSLSADYINGSRLWAIFMPGRIAGNPLQALFSADFMFSQFCNRYRENSIHLDNLKVTTRLQT